MPGCACPSVFVVRFGTPGIVSPGFQTCPFSARAFPKFGGSPNWRDSSVKRFKEILVLREILLERNAEL